MSCRKWEVRILRRQQGELSEKDEADLLRHLQRCTRCRSVEARFRTLDQVLAGSPELPLPPFLRPRIEASVIDQMRKGAQAGGFIPSVSLCTYLKPALTAIILVAGLSLGTMTGWNLAQSVNIAGVRPSQDLLSLAGMDGPAQDLVSDLLWPDNDEGIGR